MMDFERKAKWLLSLSIEDPRSKRRLPDFFFGFFFFVFFWGGFLSTTCGNVSVTWPFFRSKRRENGKEEIALLFKK